MWLRSKSDFFFFFNILPIQGTHFSPAYDGKLFHTNAGTGVALYKIGRKSFLDLTGDFHFYKEIHS